MRHTRHGLVLLLAGGLLAAATMTACGGSVTETPLTPTQSTLTTLPSTTEMLADKVMGSSNAPNTIIEYVSFFNSSSATFHLTTVPQIKSQFVDPGKAQLIFRNVLVPNEPPAAAELVRCAGTARFFDAVNLFFTNQAAYANPNNADPTATLESLMLGFGMSQAVINACVGNAALDAGLNAMQNAAINLTYLMPDGTQRTPASVPGVNSSILGLPALAVNGTLFDGFDATGTANDNFKPTIANIQAAFVK